jgi:hypothetical protein
VFWAEADATGKNTVKIRNKIKRRTAIISSSPSHRALFGA